ncbi:MAG: glycosyltransferase family 9 protein [Bacteroidetes bacterium]|nr:glycosyltransferase family 9 protein [Bacteroidota bacterium]
MNHKSNHSVCVTLPANDKSLKKILVIRFSSIGDIVLTTPVIRAVKTQLSCELYVLTKKRFSSIYKNNPHIDRVYSIDDGKNVIPELEVENFDFIVDLQKNLRSLKVKKALGKPNASFPKLNILKWLVVNLKINKLPKLHIVNRYFKAVEVLNVKNDGKGLDYFIPEKSVVDVIEIDPILSKGYVAIAIGGQHFTKILPVEKLVEIIPKIKLPVVLLGDGIDRQKGEEIVRQLEKTKVFNACGKYTLDQSASIIQQSSAVISNDTGLMHIAAALQKPIVSIWGNTIPEFGMYPYFPQHSETSIISEVKNLNCRPCSKLGYKKCPKKHFKCMMLQDEEFISESINKLVSKAL